MSDHLLACPFYLFSCLYFLKFSSIILIWFSTFLSFCLHLYTMCSKISLLQFWYFFFFFSSLNFILHPFCHSFILAYFAFVTFCSSYFFLIYLIEYSILKFSLGLQYIIFKNMSFLYFPLHFWNVYMPKCYFLNCLHSALSEIQFLQTEYLPIMYGFPLTLPLICLMLESHLQSTSGVMGKIPNPFLDIYKISRWHGSIILNWEAFYLFCIHDVSCLIFKMHCFYVLFLLAFIAHHWESDFLRPPSQVLTSSALLDSLGVET